ncbi:MAG: Uma2 family endonuclease [Candidatus Riflebacteria bacterium]|nr:Uma2 family endonuclease [Candidatus Riflebacteria bacterium]
MGVAERIRLTYADYRLLPEDGRRYEILHGLLEMSPSALAAHQAVVTRLMALLLPWILTHRLGRLFTAPMDVILAEDSIVQPDLLFITEARAPALIKDWIHGAPDLVAEVLSPGTAARDRGVKKQLYARFGVREYWLVDPESRTVTILTLKARGYHELVSGSGTCQLKSSILSGFEFTPESVFQDL